MPVCNPSLKQLLLNMAAKFLLATSTLALTFAERPECPDSSVWMGKATEIVRVINQTELQTMKGLPNCTFMASATVSNNVSWFVHNPCNKFCSHEEYGESV